jgi:hypothetical protein
MKLVLSVCVWFWYSSGVGDCAALSGQVVEGNEEQGTSVGA